MNKSLMQLKVLLAAEKKKATVLGVLFVALVFIGARSVLQAGPSKARAGVTSSERRGGSSGNAGDKNASGNDSKRAGPPIRVERPRPLTRDLFRLDEAYFPLPAQTEPPSTVPPKSRTSKVETPPQTRAAPGQEMSVAERVRKEAASLRLRGTLIGSTPMAVIEATGKRADKGTVVRPGQVVEGFTLIEVQSTGVVLEKDGVQVELRRVLPEG